MKKQDRRSRARVAAMTRHHPGSKETNDLAREFKEARLAQYIDRVVRSAPPLTEEQRGRLASLLRATEQ